MHSNQLETSLKLLEIDTPQRDDELDKQNSRLWGSERLLVTIFMFIGFFYTFMLRGNLSIAIVEMTSNKTIVVGNQTILEEPEFKWDSQTKGWILSLFSYGACLGPLGGYLSSKHGGVTVLGIGLFITAFLTMLSPFAIRTNLYVFAVGRIIEGIFETFAYTGICDVWSRWIPRHELPKVVFAGHSGYHLGAALTFPICGFIAEYYGWPMIFYFSGFIAVVWCLLLFIFVKNDPQQDKRISAGELRYIKQNIRCTDRKKMTHPWRKIFSSKPIWALCVNKFAYAWSHITVVYFFPLYVKDITNESTAVVGLLSSIPNYLNIFVAPLSGILIDYLQNHRNFGMSKLLKRTLIVGFSIGAVLFAAVGFSNFIISMICFVLIVILLSVNFNILQITVVCLSPDHAGFIAGISTLWYSTSLAVSSVVIGFIVTNHSWHEWSVCFGLCGGILLFAAIITTLFGSCEDQKWLSTEVQKP